MEEAQAKRDEDTDDDEDDDDQDEDDEQVSRMLDTMVAQLDVALNIKSSSSTTSPAAASTDTTAAAAAALPPPWQGKKERITLYDGSPAPEEAYLTFESPYPWPTKIESKESTEKRCVVAVGIMRQEARIMERMLTHLSSFVSACIITDTGSTDTTVDITRRFMLEHKWPGRIYYAPFKDFGSTRSLAVKLANGCGDYLLLTDADYKWVYTDLHFLTRLTHDVYRIGTMGDCIYFRPHLIKSHVRFCYRRRTHEYIDFLQSGYSTGDLQELQIDHIGDGGYKADKYIRDRKLLLEDLKEFGPDDARSLFYLAQTERCAGCPKEAWEWYQKRIRIRDWAEEVYYSYHQSGQCSRDLARPTYFWLRESLDAFLHQPARCEALHECVLHLTDKHHKLACAIGSLALYNDFPGAGCLFVEANVHRWKLLYRLSIASGYCTEYRLAGLMMLRRLITERQYPAHEQDDFMLSNLKWYLDYYTKQGEEEDLSKKTKYSPKRFEQERMRHIAEGDAFRNKNQCNEALQEYRKTVPLVPESLVARLLATNWAQGKVYSLPRFDRLTAYKNGAPLNVTSSPVSMQTFFAKGKAPPAATTPPTAPPAEEERKKQPEWLRECARCYASYWCGVMKKQMRWSCWDYAGDLLDAAKLAIGTPQFSWTLQQIPQAHTELQPVAEALVALVHLAAREDLRRSCFSLAKSI